LRPVTDVFNRYRYFDFEVQAPWLSQMEGAETLKTPDLDNPQLVVLNRTLQPAEYDANHERNGRRWQSFVFEKSFLPTRIGKVEVPAPLLRYHVLLKQGRDSIFGERTGVQTQNYYVYGQPLAVEVLPIPEAGRPNPFYGAVGRFTVEAALDKDSVKVGSSVKLTFTIRGRATPSSCACPTSSRCRDSTSSARREAHRRQRHRGLRPHAARSGGARSAGHRLELLRHHAGGGEVRVRRQPGVAARGAAAGTRRDAGGAAEQ